MEIFHKELVAVLLASIVWQAGYAKEATAYKIGPTQTRIAQVLPISTRISAVLPSYTEVTLKSGGSKFGKLTAINPKNQKLTLSLQNGQFESISTPEIEKVEFRINDGTVEGKPLPKLQGETRTWSNIPLSSLKVQAEKNRTEVRLPCAADSRVCKERGTSYTLKELLFTTTNKVTLVVIVAS